VGRRLFTVFAVFLVVAGCSGSTLTSAPPSVAPPTAAVSLPASPSAVPTVAPTAGPTPTATPAATPSLPEITAHPSLEGFDSAKLLAALKRRGLTCLTATGTDGTPVEVCRRSTTRGEEMVGLRVANGSLVNLSANAQANAKKDADAMGKSFLGYVAAAASYPSATPDEASRWVAGHVGQQVSQAFGPAIFDLSIDPTMNLRTLNVLPAAPTP